MFELKNENFKEILDSLNTGILLSKINGEIIFCNKYLINTLGQDITEISKISAFELLNINQNKLEIQKLEIAEKDEIFFLKTELNINNINKPFTIHVQILINSNTDRFLYFKFIEKKESTAELNFLEKDELFDNLVENSPSGIILRNKDKYLYANKKALAILGFTDLYHLQNYNLNDLFIDPILDRIKERLEKVSRGESIDFLEIKVKRPIDGKIVEIESIPSVINYKGEELYQILIKDVFLKKQLFETKLRADLAEENYLKLKKEIIQKNKYQQELSKALLEKDVFIKEVHHRVKNNLQIISSILNLEIRSLNNNESTIPLSRIQNRVKSIYLVHEIAYQTGLSSKVNLGLYIKMLCDNFVRNNEIYTLNFNYEIVDVSLTLDVAIPCGMILNETLYNFIDLNPNAEKHRKVSVLLREEEKLIHIEFSFPLLNNSKNENILDNSSLSTQLTDALVDQIGGEYRIEKTSDSEVKFVLSFEK